MIKKCNAVFIVMFLVLSAGLNAGLLDLYRRGSIKLDPDPGFGKDVEWETLIYDGKKDIVVAPDGSIFVTNTHQDNIFKFDAGGRLTATYGRRGLGPGDLLTPSCYSLLNENYLVISEYAANSRISIFDFSGKCKDVVKTKHPCFRAVGLRDNKIAYYTLKNKNEKKETVIGEALVIIKDIDSGVEKVVDAFEKVTKVIDISPTYNLAPDNFLGECFIHGDSKGNLLVGVSNTNIFKIYSPAGVLLKTFTVNIEPIPVSEAYVKSQKDSMLASLLEQPIPQEMRKAFVNAVKKTDFNKFFEKNFPYYSQVAIDSEGNILVFKWLDNSGKANENEIFQVYSPEGKFLCETILEKSGFDLEIKGNFNTIQFTKQGIFCIVKKRDEKTYDDNYRLVKIKIE